MALRSSRRLATSGTLFLALVSYFALVPELAAGHGATTTRFDAPVPLALLLAGAGATIGATATLIAVRDRSRAAPRGAGGAAHTTATEAKGLFSITVPPSPVRLLFGVSFAVAVFTAMLAGVAGRQVAADNLATVITWPLLLHGVAIVAIVLGNPWPTLSPWHLVYRGLVRLEGRTISLLSGVPGWLGYWPAVAGFLALYGILENLTVVPRSPRLTAVVLAGLTVAMVAGGVVAGPAWFRRADPLGVLFELFGRVSPMTATGTADGTLHLGVRPPWRGCETPLAADSLVVFVVAMVYTVSFDGASGLQVFQTTLFAVRDVLGTGPATSALLYLGGLAAFLAVFYLTAWLAERLGAGRGDRWRAAARAFAPTVLPIAAAYEIAHVYPAVFDALGRLPMVLGEPVGVALGPLSPLAWLSLPAFWASQVLLIVLGHVIAVLAAHHVARDRFEGVQRATRGHLPLVVLTIGYTILSLWIVSTPVVT